MREAPVYFLDIPFEKRLDYITQQYAQLGSAYLEGGIQRISKRLGGVAAKAALDNLENNDLKSCFHILLAYYDKSYLKGLHNRKHLSSLLTKVACENVTTENANLLLSNHSFA
jgi:tRNA 2-selenouridine synthase